MTSTLIDPFAVLAFVVTPPALALSVVAAYAGRRREVVRLAALVVATLSLQHLIAEQVLAMRGRRAEDHELITLCLRCHGRADGGRRYGRRVQP